MTTTKVVRMVLSDGAEVQRLPCHSGTGHNWKFCSQLGSYLQDNMTLVFYCTHCMRIEAVKIPVKYDL